MPLNHLLKPCFILKNLKSQIFVTYWRAMNSSSVSMNFCVWHHGHSRRGLLVSRREPMPQLLLRRTDTQRYTDIKQYTPEFPNAVTTFHDVSKHLPEIKVLPAAWGYQSRSTTWLPPHKMAASPAAILSSNMKTYFSIWTHVAEQRQLLITGSHFSEFGMLFKEDLLENKMRCILTHSSEEIW